MSHVSPFDAVLAQINACDGYFASQRGLISDHTFRASLQSMTDSLSHQINELGTMDVAAAARMNTAIQGTVSFLVEHKQQIASAIATRVLQPTAGKCRRGTQTLTDVRKYFTENDWKVFEDPKITLSQKVIVACDRLMLLGLKNPSETSVRAIAAALALVHFPSASPNELYGLVVDIKMGLHARRDASTDVVPPHLYICKYPDTPRDLPPDCYNLAYGHENAVHKDLSGYSAMMNKIPLRSTNRQLGPTRAASPGPSDLNPVAQLLQHIMAQPARPSDNLLTNLIINPSAGPPRSIPLAAETNTGHQLALPAPQSSLPETPQESQAGSSSQTPQQSTLPATPQASPAPAAGMPALPPLQASGTGVVGGAQDIDEPKASASDLKALVALATTQTDHGKCKAKAKGKAQGKSKETAKAKVKGKAMGKVKGKPAAYEKASSEEPTIGKAGTVKLGCGKCRGSHGGCTQCRDPNFTGKRWQRK